MSDLILLALFIVAIGCLAAAFFFWPMWTFFILLGLLVAIPFAWIIGQAMTL